ncbi:syntaxin-1A-like [Brienomyrus brachyistius]|uniref:syntaxin-1A-like n=1 Tax=Brienomyrus brachyistius TaxID=42636 RepID=UPI0020B343F5|nr:syntaxin-1A-like [Brienomyrus brachyistius]
MKNRLDELRGYQNRDEGSQIDFDLQGPGYFNAGYQEGLSSGMGEFFGQVYQLYMDLSMLRELSEEIHGKQERILCSTTAEELCGEKQLLAELKRRFSHQARDIHERLSQMKEKDWTGTLWKGSAEGRIKQSQFYSLLQQHNQVLSQHYTWETEYAGRLKEQIVRQTQLAGVELDEEEIRRLADSLQVPQLVGTDIPELEALRNLALVQERHHQLLALEEQISELHSLFLALEVMVCQQHLQMNHIEYNVLHTLDYASESSEKLKKALRYQHHSRVAALVSSLLGLCLCCGCLCCASPNLPFTK